MIVDVEKFDRLSYGSAQRVLCRCDECGVERHVVKQSILRTPGANYPRCQPCATRRVVKTRRPIRDPETHRIRTGLASKGRPKSAKAVETYRARFTGSSNPNWIPDREKAARRERSRREFYSLIHACLKRTRNPKSARSVELVGYMPEDLICHLESLFETGMSWEDRGAWHIDHVKPVSKFLDEGVTDPKIINALGNLKPVWATDNLRKSNRWSENLV